MHLRSITMKGFKSFPGRTRLDFGPGVSVIVGPNGSGKSNITDAVLWSLGEQSPLAVRGQSMKDVIFAGAHGVHGSSAAEVEVVIDNGEGDLETGFSEVSIVRRLGRDGEGEYRLNGARCRLVDVIEVLSDSGLGKEMHSVVSQGKVEQIVLSRPRERRLLIEEAAGLGKHRKRRRRAQLKLDRTEENLARALDVEREARSRLRPLKRQAEAAELHERLERQTLEARLGLAADAARTARLALAEAGDRAAAARGARDEAELSLADVARRREEAEEAFAAHTRERERLQGRLYSARSAADRIGMRLERVLEQGTAAAERRERRLGQLELLEAETDADRPEAPGAGRITELERELEELDAGLQARLEQELEGLRDEGAAARRRAEELEGGVRAARAALDQADAAAGDARVQRRQAESAVEGARARAASVGSELAANHQFVRTAAPAGARVLAEGLHVEPGYELALAATLGPRLSASVVGSLTAGEELLDAAGNDGGSALVERTGPAAASAPAEPVAGAERLLDRVRPEPAVRELAERLLAGIWVVESLAALPADTRAVAVTRSGRLFDPGSGLLVQAPSGGPERLLEELGRREQLVAAAESAATDEAQARAGIEQATSAVATADSAREAAESELRRAQREAAEAADDAARAEWLLARRREAPKDGPEAVRRAELLGDLRAEQRLAERAERERAERTAAHARLRSGAERDGLLGGAAERAAAALGAGQAAVAAQRDVLQARMDAGAAAGEDTAAALRACAHEEAQLQDVLKRASETVTAAEVTAQQARDAAAETERELVAVAGRLGLEPEPAAEALSDEERAALDTRLERLERRREQLGPVNPLAKQEYDEAVAHVEELEDQRGDLEAALAELEGLIKETDRRIREAFEETFTAAARNFEEVVQHLFPGGRGRLRLVQAEAGPRPVLGGEAPAPEEGAAPAEPAGPEEEPEAGVEIEVTPPGKATKRLSLLSGGEKSLVALAFMFAVFLARPCPFYILDEVEAALDDLNIDRFLQLLRRYSDRAQFIVVTHQKRTMDAADTLYGVSMGGDGISRVISRKLAPAEAA